MSVALDGLRVRPRRAPVSSPGRRRPPVAAGRLLLVLTVGLLAIGCDQEPDVRVERRSPPDAEQHSATIEAIEEQGSPEDWLRATIDVDVASPGVLTFQVSELPLVPEPGRSAPPEVESPSSSALRTTRLFVLESGFVLKGEAGIRIDAPGRIRYSLSIVSVDRTSAASLRDDMSWVVSGGGDPADWRDPWPAFRLWRVDLAGEKIEASGRGRWRGAWWAPEAVARAGGRMAGWRRYAYSAPSGTELSAARRLVWGRGACRTSVESSKLPVNDGNWECIVVHATFNKD